MSKDDYRNLLFDETIGYIMRSREDINTESELGAAFYAVWNLYDPIRNGMSVGTEHGLDIIFENFAKKFTAHSHLSEPLLPSPDDLARCSAMGVDVTHFITDGFLCVRFM